MNELPRTGTEVRHKYMGYKGIVIVGAEVHPEQCGIPFVRVRFFLEAQGHLDLDVIKEEIEEIICPESSV